MTPSIRLLIDVFLTIPNLMVLIVIASMLSGVSVEQMGIIIAAWAWMWPARTVRSQVLTIRERAYVQVSRLNGMSPLAIIIRELMPNLLPFVAASLVGTIAAAILASIGLSALGLGPQNEPSLGLTIYWAIFYGALIRQLWWWFVPPIVVTVVLFVGLFMTTAGLDKIANPRLQEQRLVERLGCVDREDGVVGGVADDVREAGLSRHVKILLNHLRRMGQHRLDDRGRLLGAQLSRDDRLVATAPAQGGFARGAQVAHPVHVTEGRLHVALAFELDHADGRRMGYAGFASRAR